MAFRVRLTAASDVPVSFHYRSEDGTAVAPGDYHAEDSTFTIPAGETDVQLPMYVVPDAIEESNETFLLHLSNGIGCTLVQELQGGIIIDDDARLVPQLSEPDVAMKRGLSGSRGMTFRVTLNQAQTIPVTAHAATSDLTAIAGVDYTARSQDLVFVPGEVSQDFVVTIFGAATPTSDKVMLVTLTNASVELYRAVGAGILGYGQAPIVSLTAPLAHSVFTAPAPVTISATASDPDGTIANVTFYRGEVVLGEDTSAPYSYDWIGAPPGAYQLSAVATNTHGDQTRSSTVPIAVVPPGFLDQIFFSGFE